MSQPKAESKAEYKAFLSSIASQTKIDHLSGKDINPHELIGFLDTTKDNSELEKTLAELNLMPKSDFKKAIAAKQHREFVERELGYFPKNIVEFVEKFVEREKIKVHQDGVVTRNWVVKFDDIVVTESDCTTPEIKKMYEIKKNRSFDLEKMAQELRIIRSKLNLKYHDSEISDVIHKWAEDTKEERRCEIVNSIMHTKGRASGPGPKDMWKMIEDSFFDVSETAPGFAIAVLQKFMWQAKRKSLGLEVTNHLMPVITGIQGCGKSTFVNDMLKLIKECTKVCNFTDVTDPRRIELWSSMGLFMDEMGGISKTDMDDLKRYMTTSSFSMRPMRSNKEVEVRNSATFIGCANQSVERLIRDDTGGRRFVELEFKNRPNRDNNDKIDWQLLWQSVDEEAADPMTFFDQVLKDQQEKNRNKCTVETWCIEHGSKFSKDFKEPRELYSFFKEWEDEYFKGYNTNVHAFGKKLKQLIRDERIKVEEMKYKHSGKIRFVVESSTPQPKITDVSEKIKLFRSKGRT